MKGRASNNSRQANDNNTVSCVRVLLLQGDTHAMRYFAPRELPRTNSSKPSQQFPHDNRPRSLSRNQSLTAELTSDLRMLVVGGALARQFPRFLRPFCLLNVLPFPAKQRSEYGVRRSDSLCKQIPSRQGRTPPNTSFHSALGESGRNLSHCNPSPSP